MSFLALRGPSTGIIGLGGRRADSGEAEGREDLYTESIHGEYCPSVTESHFHGVDFSGRRPPRS